MNNIILVIAIIFIAVSIIIFTPLLAIWCINTLFDTGIEYSPVNWFALAVLLAIMNSSLIDRKKD